MMPKVPKVILKYPKVLKSNRLTLCSSGSELIHLFPDFRSHTCPGCQARLKRWCQLPGSGSFHPRCFQIACGRWSPLGSEECLRQRTPLSLTPRIKPVRSGVESTEVENEKQPFSGKGSIFGIVGFGMPVLKILWWLGCSKNVLFSLTKSSNYNITISTAMEKTLALIEALRLLLRPLHQNRFAFGHLILKGCVTCASKS